MNLFLLSSIKVLSGFTDGLWGPSILLHTCISRHLPPSLLLFPFHCVSFPFPHHSLCIRLQEVVQPLTFSSLSPHLLWWTSTDNVLFLDAFLVWKWVQAKVCAPMCLQTELFNTLSFIFSPLNSSLHPLNSPQLHHLLCQTPSGWGKLLSPSGFCKQ